MNNSVVRSIKILNRLSYLRFVDVAAEEAAVLSRILTSLGVDALSSLGGGAPNRRFSSGGSRLEEPTLQGAEDLTLSSSLTGKV